ncbi:MAG: hypothetical protein WCF23_04820 [Candidatus Nitrosopolaris sp.]
MTKQQQGMAPSDSALSWHRDISEQEIITNYAVSRQIFEKRRSMMSNNNIT